MNIGIITGGYTSEREISLRSAEATKNACDSLGYNSSLYKFPEDCDRFILQYKNIDFVFIMIHGIGGEDGQIASFLDTLGIPYQCTNPRILNKTIDKRITKQIWRQYNIPVAQDKLINLNQEFPIFKYPCVLKALDQGSSIGVIICKTAKQFEQGIENIKKFNTIMIEELLEGSECTVSILDNIEGGEPLTLPIIEIIPPQGEEFDYNNKYNNQTQEICPARYDDKLTQEIQHIALQAYKTVGCTQYGRIDMIITKDGPKCLEINTIPGFTNSSLFPKSAKEFGLEFPKLIQYLIDLKMKK